MATISEQLSVEIALSKRNLGFDLATHWPRQAEHLANMRQEVRWERDRWMTENWQFLSWMPLRPTEVEEYLLAFRDSVARRGRA